MIDWTKNVHGFQFRSNVIGMVSSDAGLVVNKKR